MRYRQRMLDAARALAAGQEPPLGLGVNMPCQPLASDERLVPLEMRSEEVSTLAKRLHGRVVTFRIGIAAALSLLAASACSTAATPAARPAPTVGSTSASVAVEAGVPPPFNGPHTPIEVGIQGVGGPLEIAFRRSYFAQQGLDLEEIPFNSGSEASQALATNQVQVGSGSPNAATFNALGRNIELSIVGDWSHVGSPTDTTLALLVGKGAQQSIRSCRT